jgi:hypothetical protein
MTLQELLEQAHLEALGLLDEREQASFEAAFAVAPPAVKAHVKAEQARWAPMEELLPQVEPPVELRDRVLDAVTAAMVSQGAGELGLKPGKRVSWAWRATSMGLMTAVVVLGASIFYINSTIKDSEQQIRDGGASQGAIQYGYSFMKDALYNPATTRVVMTNSDTAAAFTGTASIFQCPDWDHARLFCQLPKASDNCTYRVVVIDPKTNAIGKQLDEFSSSGPSQSRKLPKLAPGTTIALVEAVIDQGATSDRILLTATV